MIKFKSKSILASDKFPATLLEVKVLRKSAVAYPSDLQKLIIPPNISRDRGIIISGRLPVWLFLGISESLVGFPWKATLDPRLVGAVVTATASLDAPNIGEVVTIPKLWDDQRPDKGKRSMSPTVF